MIRLKVYDVGPPYPLHATPVLWLADEQEEQVLILLIGIAEAFAIKSQIDAGEEAPPRPMTHDLLNSVFEHFDAEIEFVLISELREQQFYIAEIHVKANGQSMTIDSRPTDAIALALRADAPIYVEEEVMRAAGKRMPRSKDENGEDALAASIEELEAEAGEQGKVPAAQVAAEELMESVEFKRQPRTPLETARQKLQAAIDEERYEDAARLRDEINRLEQSA